MKKRLTGLALALIMLVTLLPVTAWAGDYDNFGVYAVSIWEKGSTEPVNCDGDASGSGWSYDSTAKTLLLNGFDGEFIILGKTSATVVLAAGSENKSAYGMLCDGADAVTITGSGTLVLGNILECSGTDLTISNGTVRVEQATLPEFHPNITVERWPDIYQTTGDISTGKCFHSWCTGVTFFSTSDELTMAGGSLTVSGTEYGIKGGTFKSGGKCKGYDVSGGTITIENVTESAVYMEVSDYTLTDEEMKAAPEVVFQGAIAVDGSQAPLTWTVVGSRSDINPPRSVQLYTAGGDIAKSAYFTGTSTAENRVVSISLLSTQPVILVEGVDGYYSYGWNEETDEPDPDKKYFWYDINSAAQTLTVRVFFLDGTIKEGLLADVLTDGWSAYAMNGNYWDVPWTAGTYTGIVKCRSGNSWSTGMPSMEFPIKIIAAVQGDATGDGATTILDVQAAYDALTGNGVMTAGQRKMLDMNGDKVLDVYDLQYLYEVAAGVIQTEA